MRDSSPVATGLTLTLLGVWLLLQTVAGDLAGRLLSYRAAATGLAVVP